MKNRVLQLYAIADGRAAAGPGDPAVVIRLDELGPLNLQRRPGKRRAPRDRVRRGPAGSWSPSGTKP